MSHVFEDAPEPATELGRYRILSSTAGVRVSPLCLGALSIGDAWKSMLGSMDQDSSWKLLDAYFEAGGNFIDTSNNYQDEQSEKWLGEWMKEKGNRDMLVIATKFSSNHRSYELGKGRTVNYAGNHRKSIHISVNESLKKLQTDYIDLLYLHWWDWTTSIPELMDSLHILVEQGKVLYLGVSNTPAWIVSTANTYAQDHGKTPFSVYQGRWNVMLRDFEREIIPMTRHFGMALIPWDAIGGGKFQTKRQIEDRQKTGEGLRSMLGSGQSAQEADMSEALEIVAGEHGLTSLAAVALAYLIQKAPNVIPIIGGRKIEHLHDNVRALSLKLTDSQMKFLESRTEFDIGFPANFVGENPFATGENSRLLSTTAKIAYPVPPKPYTKQ